MTGKIVFGSMSIDDAKAATWDKVGINITQLILTYVCK